MSRHPVTYEVQTDSKTISQYNGVTPPSGAENSSSREKEHDTFPKSSNCNLPPFQEDSGLRESLGFDPDSSLPQSGNFDQLATSSWPKSQSFSQLHMRFAEVCRDKDFQSSGSHQPDSKQYSPVTAACDNKQSNKTEAGNRNFLFYLRNSDTQTSSTEDSANKREIGNSLCSREPGQISVRALRLSDADISCDDVGNSWTAEKDYGRLVNVTSHRTSPTSSSSDSDQSSKLVSNERNQNTKSIPCNFGGSPEVFVSLSPTDLQKATPSVSTSCSFPSLDELAEHADSLTCLYDEEDEGDIDSGARKRRNRLSNVSSTSEDSGVSRHTIEDGDLLRQ
ncbi:hypothetical protein ElyMa_006919700, partial [Elysia marginata]